MRGKPSATTQERLKQRLFRALKRKMIDDGVIMDPKTRPKKYLFHWWFGSLAGECYADTKSEARAIIKHDLGLPKKKWLPKEVEITRYDNTDYIQGMMQSHANLSQSDGAAATSPNVWSGDS